MTSRSVLVALVVFSALTRAEARSKDESDALFAREVIPEIRIRVAPEELDKLKAEPRNYVRASLREDDRATIGDVALKLKGAAGSFREWDDRPALTLNMRKFRPGGTLHGLVKFHLNNSVQDETYLNELLCSELFRRAGVPAPRVTHARLWLNDRDVGLYVLKEGFDKPFLKRSFADPTGNLYDGGFVQDIDADLEKDEGSNPDDRSDLRAVAEAAREPDPIARVRRVEALVDMDAFLSFMAMERMTCHWDGYANTANNYRVYFDPRRRKAVFLPHGMDQMFGDPEMGVFDPSDKIVAGVVFRSDALRRRFRERVAKLLPLMAPADDLLRRVEEVDRRIGPFIEAIDREQAAGRASQVAALKERLVARAANLRKQIDEPEGSPQSFDDRGIAALDGGWFPFEAENAALDEVEADPGRKALRIAAGGGAPCVASWRRHVLLGPGVYTLKAEIRTDRVLRLEDAEVSGVGVGISGVAREQHADGTTGRKSMSHRFEVREDRDLVVLVLELRARSGSAWFELDSLQLVREADGAAR